MRKQYPLYILLVIFTIITFGLNAQSHEDHGHDDHAIEQVHSDTSHDADAKHDDHAQDESHGCGEHHGAFDAGANAVHHISDANIYSIGPFNIPLPCIIYVKGEGMKFFSSSKFAPGKHGNGHYAVDNFVLNGGSLNRVSDASFPTGKHEVCDFGHKTISIEKTDKEGNVKITEKEVSTVILKDGKGEFVLEQKTTIDGGLFGGSITSFYDFSITKNVATMWIVFFALTLMFLYITKSYKKREGNAPKGIQSVIEPIFTFIQDEVAKPILGHSWEKYQPFLMSLFFFILGLNLFGLVPFFGGSNVTGNISVTIALSIFAALVVNLSGNRHYWQHIFWMPGVPAPVKLILTPVEVLGVFLKPITLFIRLFGNISAGHMVILIFTSLIFIFGNDAQGNINAAGSGLGIVMATLLGMFMMALELLVAFLQAFVFTILTAVYIGSAIEDHH